MASQPTTVASARVAKSLWRDVKVRCARLGCSVQEFVDRALRREIKATKK